MGDYQSTGPHSNLADWLPKQADEIQPDTWFHYRQNILKISQKDLNEFLGLRSGTIEAFERGKWSFFQSSLECADLIRQLCIHTGESKEMLFPEFQEIWDYLSGFDTNLEEVIDQYHTDADYDVMKQQFSNLVRKVLKTLTPREEKILRMRFGIGEESDHTLEEIGHDFWVTREKIRQIEARALRKLRHPSCSGQLKDFESLNEDEIRELKHLILENSHWYKNRNQE